MHARKTNRTSGMWLRRLGKAIVAVVASTAMLTVGAYAAPAEGSDLVTLGDQPIQTTVNGDTTTTDGGTTTEGDSTVEGTNTTGTNGEGTTESGATVPEDQQNTQQNGGETTTESLNGTQPTTENQLQGDSAILQGLQNTQSTDGTSATTSADEGISLLAVDDPDHLVEGVTPRGTTIDLFDYWLTNRNAADGNSTTITNNDGINQNHVLKFGKGMGDGDTTTINSSAINRWTQSTEPRQGIVSNRLGEDGYPYLSGTNGIGTESLGYLFDDSSHAGKAAFMDVSGLLQVDRQGYYYYNSQDNFAQFNDDGQGSGDFTLYEQGGVTAGGRSPNGQFFPFNTGEDVFSEQHGTLTNLQIWDGTLNGGHGDWRAIKSTDSAINHYFGVHMSTRFVQPEGGQVEGTRTPMTYNFSGDDDVWVFIDDVLVGDLGGIHDMSSLEINFKTGRVYVYNDANKNNEYDSGETIYNGNPDWQGQRRGETIRDLMRAAGVSTGLFDDTFANNTYHTLDFFYLERGNSDSNMSLKYNLVIPPETDIVKVDQDGAGIDGAEFGVYLADADYNINQNDPICTATTGTDGDGQVVLLNEDGSPLTFDRLWDLYGDKNDGYTQNDADGGRRVNLVLRETSTPDGYRSAGDMRMYLWHKDSGDVQGADAVNLLLSDMNTTQTEGTSWQTGVYSQPTVLVTAPNRLTLDNGTSVTTQTMPGRLFAVVEKNIGNDSWVPVYGSHLGGWTIADDNGIQSIQAADAATNATFLLASSGSHQALIGALPGRIQDYVFFHTEDDSGTYRGAYYYTTAGDNASMNGENTHRVSNTNDFGRQFAAHLYVPNIKNRVIVQKTDESGTPLDGAQFTLYQSNPDGTAPDETQPVGLPVTTRTLNLENDKINLNGAAVFDMLTEGTYWIVETKAPNGYTISTAPAKVIVTNDGVYADAGVENDGIKVQRGVGRIVHSMVKFAVDDDIDASLHDIIAQPKLANNATDIATGAGNLNGPSMHLRYHDDDKAVLDYVTYDAPPKSWVSSTDTGILYMTIQQCNGKTAPDSTHDVTEPRAYDLGDADITSLFTGVTVVQVADQAIGSLKVSKTVVEGQGQTLPADAMTRDFEFTITLKTPSGVEGVAAQPLSGEFVANVYNVTNNQPAGNDALLNARLTFNADGVATVLLKHDQYLVIEGLPEGTKYTVVETAVDGYTTSYTGSGSPAQPAGVTGSISQDTNPGSVGQQVGVVQGWAAGQQVDVTNTYDLSTKLEAGSALTVVKRLTGSDLSGTEGDPNNFGFTVTPQDNQTGGTSAADAAAKLTGASDNGVLSFRNGAVAMSNGVAVNEMTPITSLTFTSGDAGKTFTYVVAETVPAEANRPAGYVYDTDPHTVAYTVNRDGNQLSVAVTVDGHEVSDEGAVPTVTFENSYVAPVSSLPLTGGDATARSLILAGGGVLLVAGAAWLLARRRRV